MKEEAHTTGKAERAFRERGGILRTSQALKLGIHPRTLYELRDELEGSRHLPTIDRPIPVVLSGGTAKPAGFLQKFESMLKASNLPIEISDIRMAKDPLTATATGCYIAAMSEAK